MAHVSRDDILKIARLARLRLTEEDIVKYGKEIDSILSYVEQLQSIDTSGIKPTINVTGLTNVSREDKLIDYGVTKQDLLANAPDQEDGSFKVKRVLS